MSKKVWESGELRRPEGEATNKERRPKGGLKQLFRCGFGSVRLKSGKLGVRFPV